MIQLRTKNLKKYYQRGPHLIKALDGIDLEVERGCFLAVIRERKIYAVAFAWRIGRTDGGARTDWGSCLRSSR